MMDLFRAAILKSSTREHELSDEAVMNAVNLGAMVHNLLVAYEQGIESNDFTRFRQKIYDLSIEFHRPEVADARENMRKEWVRRCTRGME